MSKYLVGGFVSNGPEVGLLLQVSDSGDDFRWRKNNAGEIEDHIVAPSYLWFHFLWFHFLCFQFHVVNGGLKI